jgi:hypothetical protein
VCQGVPFLGNDCMPSATLDSRPISRSLANLRFARCTCAGLCRSHSFKEGAGSIGKDKLAELPQLPANHGDRARWERVHAVGRGGNRDVLILSRGVAILHKSYRSDE